MLSSYPIYANIDTNTVYCHIKVFEGTGNWYYNNTYRCCTGAGFNCRIHMCPDSKLGSLVETTGGYTLELTLDNVTLDVLSPAGVWEELIRSGSDYHFADGEYLEISECTSHPELVGRTFPLTGLITDNIGKFSLFIPN